MAVRETERLVTLGAGGIAATGDASARPSTDGATHWGWNNTDGVMLLGSDDKALAPESSVFLRFNIEDVAPADEVVTRARLEIFSYLIATDGGSGKFRLGWLNQDGIWNHKTSTGFTPTLSHPADPWAYSYSYSLPFPTLEADDDIIVGKVYLNSMWGPFTYDASHASQKLTMGDDGFTTATTWEANDMGTLIQFARDSGWKHVAFVLDGYEVPDGVAEYMQIFSEDNTTLGTTPGSGVWGPSLFIQFKSIDEVRSVGISTDVAVHHVGTSVKPSVSSAGATADPAISSLSAAVYPAVKSLGVTVDPAVSRIT